MTEDGLIKLFTALGTVSASVTAAIVAVASLRKARENGVKADQIIVKSDEIHQLTNSRLSAVTSELAVMVATVASMKNQIDGMTAAKVVADSVAQRLAETRKES